MFLLRRCQNTEAAILVIQSLTSHTFYSRSNITLQRVNINASDHQAMSSDSGLSTESGLQAVAPSSIALKVTSYANLSPNIAGGSHNCGRHGAETQHWWYILFHVLKWYKLLTTEVKPSTLIKLLSGVL